MIADLAQLAEHLICNQRVSGSNPLIGMGDEYFSCIIKYLTPTLHAVRHLWASRQRCSDLPVIMEDYPSLAKGNGLENRQVTKVARGFESHIFLHLSMILSLLRNKHRHLRTDKIPQGSIFGDINNLRWTQSSRHEVQKCSQLRIKTGRAISKR